MTFQEHIQEKIYKGTPGKFQRPETLYHENTIEGDMRANHSQWNDINGILPLRPQGNFFWGEEMSGHCQLQVRVADLDSSKLFAFPSALAIEADELVVTFMYKDRRSKEAIKEAEMIKEVLQKCEAIPYSEYKGQFAAEWIYTEDIPSELLQRRVTA